MRWRKGKTFLVCLLGGTDTNDVERYREALSPEGIDTLPDYVDDPEDEESRRNLLRNRAMFQLGVTGWENIKVVVKPMSDGKHWVASVRTRICCTWGLHYSYKKTGQGLNLCPVAAFYLFLYPSAASTNPLKSGCGLLGRDFNSGCACVATKKGWSGSSHISTMRPSGDSPESSMPFSVRTARKSLLTS